MVSPAIQKVTLHDGVKSGRDRRNVIVIGEKKSEVDKAEEFADAFREVDMER